ncbi:MAG: UDP-N-acetylmuramoyl-L-alanine--D-glutamate ligase [Thioalkalispiraceae bacterium]|jgi:UDP-N-acetylmuramoylalanine--D-glutamate ligase
MQKADKKLICADLFAKQQVLVVGLGKTGVSCLKFLMERNVNFAVMDSREQPPGMFEVKNLYPGVEIHTGRLNEELIKQFDVLIVSPGVSLKEHALQFAAELGKQLIGDIEILAMCTSKPIVAITGSNGKSTVTTLLGEMARQAKLNVVVAGNIGMPVLENINEDAEVDLYCLELSSFQLETTHSLNAVASTILNISEDHLDRYDSVNEYAAAKHKIISGNGYVIVNLDEPNVLSLIRDDIETRQTLGFTLNKPVSDDQFGLIEKNNEDWLAQGNKCLIPVSELKIKGQHNVANVLAALAVGTAISLPMPAMLEAARRFTGLPHRTQWVTEANGVQWFNDSKATNVGATIAALKGLATDNLILILGGLGKGQDFSELGKVVQQHTKLVLVLGEDAELITQAIGSETKVEIVKDLKEAIEVAHRHAVEGDFVLLSPACASFDMFDGYEHRGNEYMRLVREMVL